MADFNITELVVERRIPLLMKVRCEIVMCKNYVYFILRKIYNLSLINASWFQLLKVYKTQLNVFGQNHFRLASE